MKVAVISDTHGSIETCINSLRNIDNIDLIIHLGDNTSDAKAISNSMKIEAIVVKGNCDFSDNSFPDDKIIEIEGKKVFITHGHKYSVKSGLNSIYYRGKELDADIILFGHSHTPILVKYDDILFMNPGSASLPRAGSKKSIGIIEIGDKIDAQIMRLE